MLLLCVGVDVVELLILLIIPLNLFIHISQISYVVYILACKFPFISFSPFTTYAVFNL